MMHPTQVSLLNNVDDMTVATNMETFIIYVNDVTLST
jgi:hypothetical protein